MFAVMLRAPSVALPGHVTVEEAAEASRRAVSAFLALDPDKASLSAWLEGPYREATGFGPRRLRKARPDASSFEHPTGPTNIEDLVNMTKTVVVATFAAAQRGIDDLVELLPPVVQVAPAHDVDGNKGFIPVDEARMRLVDRVLALLVADYLTRPNEFRTSRPLVSGTHSTDPWLDLDLNDDNTG
jgi:hypothetical protein